MRKIQGRNEAKHRDILSNFEGELLTTSTAQSNSQCLLLLSSCGTNRYLKDLFCQILTGISSLGMLYRCSILN